jgi:hypothetical protein
LVATTLEQIPPTRCGISSFPHQSSSPWTEMPSSSKCRESSLAFAQGLRWWQAVAAHLDLFSLSHGGRNSRGSEGDFLRSIRAVATEENEKP